MNRQNIEAWALSVYDSVVSKAKIEDSFVELKSNWPEPQKAARRIAAHANASRGSNILWLIGLDEDQGLVDFQEIELSEWWEKVKSYFVGSYPSLTNYNITISGKQVHILYFVVSASPFVVKNPAFGKSGAGPVEREVPWREGTSVRSATREDLLRLLVPLTTLPDIEILKAEVEVNSQQAIDSRYEPEVKKVQTNEHLKWKIEINMYVTPQVENFVVFPNHRTSMEILFDSEPSNIILPIEYRYFRPSYWTFEGSKPDSVSVETTSSEAIIHIPGRLHFRASYYEPIREIPLDKQITLLYKVNPSGTTHSIEKRIKLMLVIDDKRYHRRWFTSNINEGE